MVLQKAWMDDQLLYWIFAVNFKKSFPVFLVIGAHARLMEISIPVLAKISSRKRSSFSGSPKNPAPFPLAVTVPEGHPRFKFTSLWPYSSRKICAVLTKSSALLVRIWGTTGSFPFVSGDTSLISLLLSLLFGCVVRVK